MSDATIVDETETVSRPDAGPRVTSRAWLAVAGVVVVVLAGIAMRAWLLHTPAGVLDSDEAVPGLMARHLIHGHFRTFYWGQEYGGTIEVFVDAFFVLIAGSSRLALKTPPIVEAVVIALLVWRIGRRVAGERVGVVAALMTWIWPAGYVWYSTKERVFYEPLVILGLVVVLLALRLADDPGRRRDWLVLGLAVGIGWWTGPQIVYMAVPAAAWLVWRLRARVWPGVALAALSALVGAAPWLRANVRTGFASLDTRALDDHKGYLSHLKTILGRGIPSALGLRHTYTERWLLPPLGPLLYVVAIAAMVFAAYRLRHRPAVRLVVLAAAAFPFLAASSPTGGYVGEGRYMLYVWPVLALLLAAAVTPVSPRVAPRVAASVVLVVAVGAISLAGLRRLPDVVSPYAVDVRVPADVSPLVRGLERHDIRRVFTDYWIAYRLDLESEERVTATPTLDVRNQDYLAAVRASDRAAYVFVSRSSDIERFTSGLTRIGIPYERLRFDRFVAIVPARRTSPEAVQQAVGGPPFFP